jgi:hypothetical protein
MILQIVYKLNTCDTLKRTEKRSSDPLDTFEIKSPVFLNIADTNVNLALFYPYNLFTFLNKT